MKLKKMLNGNVLVRKIDEGKTQGGVIIPHDQSKDAELGQVVNCSEFILNVSDILIPSEVNIGDYVLYDRYGVEDYEESDENMVVIREDRILGVLNESN